MRRSLQYTCSLLLFGVMLASSQGQQKDTFSIPVTDPARPVMLKVGLIAGSISVKAADTKEVVVTVERRGEKDEDPDHGSTRGGLKRIPNTSTGLSIEEDDNEVTVSTGIRGMNSRQDLTITVPRSTSVKLSTINDGDIRVEGISGEMEVNNTNGSVTLLNVSGSAVAHALNEDLKAVFTSVTAGKPMSFSSLNGDIDVTLPSSTKATLNLKSDQGEIYTDFDIAMERISPKVESGKEGNRRKVVVEKGMRGTINGGGPEFQFKNFTGDILIRKGK